MFALLKRQKNHKPAAKAIYASALENTRKPEFYETYGIPDSFDGRFDLLLIHIFVVLQRMLADDPTEAEALNQAIFDVTFADMDQTLREMGIGDVGIPKHQRRMMTAFNGRMHAYEAALKKQKTQGGIMITALEKNLYGTVESPDKTKTAAMANKIQTMIAALKTQDSNTILNGKVTFQ